MNVFLSELRESRSVGFEKLGASEKELAGETFRSELAKSVREELLGEVKPDSCRDVNEAAELLAPLPIENMAGLAALISRATIGGSRLGKGPPVCKATDR